MKSLKLLIILCLKVIINKRLQKKFKRTCELLIHFEGLQCIAANPEEHWIVFAEKCLLGKSNCNRLINMF